MSPANRKHIVLACGAIVLLAVAVRLFTWQDNSRDIWKVQTSVVEGYMASARQLAAGEFEIFASDINHFGHPPGYSILLAAVFKIAGESTAVIHLVQILCDAVAVVLLFMIALELFSLAVAVIAASLAAISPQFAYVSVLLLPDSLIVAPILLAVYFVLRARRDRRMRNFVIAGALIGLSCWFRSNAMLLPFFLALAGALLVERGKRLRTAGAVVAGALIVIAPITIKNALVYDRFVPLSLGAGQTMVEGIADYDQAQRFNLPNTDLGLMRQEAEWYGNPEYAQLLFGRDGIERDRMRLARGFAVIRSDPFWFTGVVIRRGIDSTRLEPVPVLAPESPVSHDVTRVTPDAVWNDQQPLYLKGDDTEYGTIKSSEVINIKPGTDYLFLVPVKLEEGRVQLKVTDASEKKVLASMGIDLVEGVAAQDQPNRLVTLPFVSAHETEVRFVVANYASKRSVVQLGPKGLFELGPSSMTWLRYVRMPLGFLQRAFKTAWMLPLAVIALLLLIRKRSWQTLLILLAVPAYYLTVQSVLHTERRYVYVIHFFFLIFVAVTLYSLFNRLRTVLNHKGTKTQS